MYRDYFGEILTAMVTPFDRQGEIDWQALDRLIEHLIEQETDTFVVTGSTGEAATLSYREKVAIYRHVVDRVDGRAKVLAGTGTNNTQETIELSREAMNGGVHGLMLVAPYYNKPPQAALFAHFEAVAGSVDLPILIYNVPGRTAINIEPKTIVELSKIENIFGVKEASGNLDQVSAIRAQAAPDFIIYSGDDSLTLPILSVGGHGVVSVASHLIGRQLKEMVRAYKIGDSSLAQRLHLQLFPLCRALFVTSNPIPLKAALNSIGVKVGAPRLPLLACSEKELATVQNALINLGFVIKV